MTASTRGAHCAGLGCAHAHAETALDATPAPRVAPRATPRGRRAARRRDRIPADLGALGSGRRVATPVPTL